MSYCIQLFAYSYLHTAICDISSHLQRQSLARHLQSTVLVKPLRECRYTPRNDTKPKSKSYRAPVSCSDLYTIHKPHPHALHSCKNFSLKSYSSHPFFSHSALKTFASVVPTCASSASDQTSGRSGVGMPSLSHMATTSAAFSCADVR